MLKKKKKSKVETAKPNLACQFTIWGLQGLIGTTNECLFQGATVLSELSRTYSLCTHQLSVTTGIGGR